MSGNADPPLTPSEIASLRWMAWLGRIQNVPYDHIETLLQAGYITESLIDPVTPSGLKRLDRESKIMRATTVSREVSEVKRSRRFWVLALLAAATGLLCIVALIWPDWIEGVIGVDPDSHNGFVEWAIVAALFGSTTVLSRVAAGEWRRSRRITTSLHYERHLSGAP
jgi:hypothetical protein